MKPSHRITPLLLGLAWIGAGGGAAYWGWQQSETARQEKQQQAARLQQIETRLSRIQADAPGLAQSWRRFEALREQGFFAPEQRLEWVEILRQTQTRLALPGIQYEFQPPRPLEQGNGQFMVSSLQLQLSLNHEMELEPFLQSLANRGKVLILPHECDFSPIPERASPPEPGPNIRVNCRLDWITGRLPGENPQ